MSRSSSSPPSNRRVKLQHGRLLKRRNWHISWTQHLEVALLIRNLFPTDRVTTFFTRFATRLLITVCWLHLFHMHPSLVFYSNLVTPYWTYFLIQIFHDFHHFVHNTFFRFSAVQTFVRRFVAGHQFRHMKCISHSLHESLHICLCASGKLFLSILFRILLNS